MFVCFNSLVIDIGETDKEILSEMSLIKQGTTKVADVLTEHAGKIVNSQDVKYIVSRLKNAKYVATIEDNLR